MITRADVGRLERCIADGGVAVFPADTVYGLACDPDNADAVRRLYELKGRGEGKPAAVMFFDRELALAALPELGPRSRAALERLLPGAVTLVVPNPRGRFPHAGGGEGGAGMTLGIRVPALPERAAALVGLRRPILQSSANRAGGPDPRRLEDVPAAILTGADLVLDAGELPGTASTVVDLRGYEADGSWLIVRAGAVSHERIARALARSALRSRRPRAGPADL